jgi:hypothetical protein
LEGQQGTSTEDNWTLQDEISSAHRETDTLAGIEDKRRLGIEIRE